MSWARLLKRLWLWMQMTPRPVPNAAAGMALIAQVAGQSLIAYAFARLPAAMSSVSLVLQPVLAAVFAWILLGESMTPLQMAGDVVVLIGIVLAKRYR